MDVYSECKKSPRYRHEMILSYLFYRQPQPTLYGHDSPHCCPANDSIKNKDEN